MRKVYWKLAGHASLAAFMAFGNNLQSGRGWKYALLAAALFAVKDVLSFLSTAPKDA